MNSEKVAFLHLTVGIWAWPGRMRKNALGKREGIPAGRKSMSNCVEVEIAKILD